MSAADYPQLLNMIATGQLDPCALVAEHVPLADVVQRLPHLADNRSAGMTIAIIGDIP
jgi:threonine dehydrogenase-like Zn-dependent dehydrogenase